jgi:hypothetical protein
MLTRGSLPGSYQRCFLCSTALMGSTIGFSETGHRTINVHMIGPKTNFWETPQPSSSQILRKPYINSLIDACGASVRSPKVFIAPSFRLTGRRPCS